MRLNQTDEAVDAYQRVIALESGRASAWFSLGRLYFERGKVYEAEHAFEQAAELTGRGEETDSWLELCSRRNNDEHQVAYCEGCRFEALGEYEEARDCFRDALVIAPDFMPALLHLHLCNGEESICSRDYQQAASHFESALAVDPAHSEARKSAAYCLYRVARFHDAIIAWDLYLSNNGLDAGALIHLAACYSKCGQPEAAEKVISRASEHFSTSQEWYSWSTEEDGETAIIALTQAVRLQPGYLQAWLDLGYVYLEEKDDKRALNALKCAVTIDPRQSLAWLRIAECQRRAGETDDALRAFENALRSASSEEFVTTCWWEFLKCRLETHNHSVSLSEKDQENLSLCIDAVEKKAVELGPGFESNLAVIEVAAKLAILGVGEHELSVEAAMAFMGGALTRHGHVSHSDASVGTRGHVF